MRRFRVCDIKGGAQEWLVSVRLWLLDGDTLSTSPLGCMATLIIDREQVRGLTPGDTVEVDVTVRRVDK